MASNMDVCQEELTVPSLLQQLQEQVKLQNIQMQQQQQIITDLQAQHLNLKNNQNPLRTHPPTIVEPSRERLPVLEKFHGDRSTWDEWHLSAIHKLNKDGDFIGDGFDQFMYLYSRLAGNAARMVSTVAKGLSEDRIGDGEQFLEYLNSVFGDPNKKARAQQDLLNIKQGPKERFAAFLPRFETLMATAGMSSYSEGHKISLLKNAINKELKERLVGSDPFLTWAAFVSKLHTISSDLAALSFSYPILVQSQNQHKSNTNEMEWEPTKPDIVTNTMGAKSSKRAKLVSKEILDFRRKQGLCIRCGNKGHKPPGCSYLPPLFKNLNVNNTNFEQETDEEEDENEIEIRKLAQSEEIGKRGKVKLL